MDIYVGVTDDRGWGVFAGRRFTKGSVLFQSTGMVIPFQTEHSLQIDWDRHLDADPPACYLNHSCEPNAGVRTGPEGFPTFVALRDIEEGEEIVYDYAMTEYRHYERPSPELEFDLTCHCGSKRCRGKFGYYSELSDELKEEYAGFVSEYLESGGSYDR